MLEKLCIHTITTKQWNLQTAAKKYSAKGIKGITVWRNTIEAGKHGEAQQMLRDHELDIVSYVRGGFFTAKDGTQRQASIDDNLRCIDEAAALGAPLIVMVCGATPGQSLEESRKQIADGFAAILPHAEKCNIKLGIEPLHPMYADCRSAVNTLKQSNDLCDQLNSSHLGITLDVFHVWWDDQLYPQIEYTSQKNRMFSFHICDWNNEPTDLLNDRGLMGDGIIEIKKIQDAVEQQGFSGYREVEVFSNKYWAMDPDQYLEKIVNSYQQYNS